MRRPSRAGRPRRKKIARGMFGAELHAIRRMYGKPQTEMAREIGVSQATFSKIENGDVEPDLRVWLRFCRLYSVNVYPRGFK